MNPTTREVVGEVQKSKYNKHNPFYLVKIASLRHKLGLELRMIDVLKILKQSGFLILGKGGDGSSSSWIIAIDPNIPEHKMFMEKICTLWRILKDIMMNFDYYVGIIQSNPTLMDSFTAYFDAILADLEDGLSLPEAVARLSFTVYDEGYLLDLVNPKVRPVKGVCNEEA